MKTSELIKKLQNKLEEFGDLNVVGDCEDKVLVKLTAIDTDSCEAFTKQNAAELLVEVY